MLFIDERFIDIGFSSLLSKEIPFSLLSKRNVSFLSYYLWAWIDKAGEWSDDSDSLSIDEDEIANYGGSGRWVQDGTGWWYSYDTGGYPASCWKQIDGAWYHFNSSGYMQTGWLRLDGEWYYLAGNGAMMTGWQAINGKWYYLGTDGVMYADTWTPDGRYVNGSGAWVQ